MADKSAVLSLVIRAKNEAGGVLKAVGGSMDYLRSRGNDVVKMFTSLKALAAAGLGLAGVSLSVATLSSELRELVAELDQVDKRARSLGLPVDQFLALTYAAQRFGGTAETLPKALSKIDVAIASNNEALEELGINLDGLDAQGRLEALGEAFAAIPSQADKMRLAVKLFGDELALQVLPLLNDQLAETKQRFEELTGGSLSLAVDDAVGIQKAFGDVALASKATKAAVLDSFGPEIEAVLLATADTIAANRAEMVAWLESSVPTGEGIVDVVGQIAGGFAGMAKTIELSIKSSLLLILKLYESASYISDQFRKFAAMQGADQAKEDLRLLDIRLTNLKEMVKEYERLGKYYQNNANNEKIALEYSQKIKQATIQITALEATRAEKTKTANEEQYNAFLKPREYMAEIAELQDELAKSIIGAGTISDAFAASYTFAAGEASKLLERARAINVERAKGGAAAPGAPTVQDEQWPGVNDGGQQDMAGPDPNEWRDWMALRDDARRAVDEAVAGSEAAPLAERESAMRRIVESEIEAERVRYESVLTEQQLVELADARRASLDGQLASMREVAALSSQDLFAGMSAGFDRLQEQFSIGQSGADAVSQSFNALQGQAAGFFQSIMDGSMSAGDAFKQFAQGLISSLLGVIAQMLATIAVAAILNVLLGGIPAGMGIVSGGLGAAGGLGGMFGGGGSKSSGGGGSGSSAASTMMEPGIASPSQSLVQTNVTNIQAVDAPSFQRLLARNSDSVAETVAGETNANFTLRSALGR